MMDVVSVKPLLESLRALQNVQKAVNGLDQAQIHGVLENIHLYVVH